MADGWNTAARWYPDVAAAETACVAWQRGFAPDLVVAAAAARPWLDGQRPGAVAAGWPFLGSVALAEAASGGTGSR